MDDASVEDRPAVKLVATPLVAVVATTQIRNNQSLLSVFH
jgi:hypothetical protein